MNDRSGRHEKTLISEQDKTAFQQLVQEHYRFVFGVCYSMLVNVHDAEDATQETMIKGFLKRGSLKDPEQFRPWIQRVARNLCIDWLRRRKVQKPPVTDDPPIQSVQDSHAQQGLEQAIKRLPAELRVPLLMYYFDSQSAKSIAEHLNISHSGACQRLRLARQQLHRMLTERDRI
ncbi:MAG: sigma-70 family RNA polymerase sigma factor [Phycisphaeraceae bacterium]|nr:sigma-70 family RNA polymerase sigma factor [Phycisphaeraceae bacterium]